MLLEIASCKLPPSSKAGKILFAGSTMCDREDELPPRYRPKQRPDTPQQDRISLGSAYARPTQNRANNIAKSRYADFIFKVRASLVRYSTDPCH